jgi:acetylornithine deacetylase
MMAHVIVALEEVDRRLNADVAHPLLGHGAVLVSLVHGGRELFTYPAECRAQFVWRTLPGQDHTSVSGELANIMAALKERDHRFDAAIEWQISREPLLASADTPIAKAVRLAVLAECGHEPEVAGAPWWTDGALIQAAGIPSVIFGPPGGGIHSADEWVDLVGLDRFQAMLLNLIRSFCA